MAAEIILAITAALLAWTYLIYPAAVIMAANLKKRHTLPSAVALESLPSVTVVMSLHNEKEVAEKKIRSMLASEYPAEKLDFIIGSDGSDDGTGAVITAMAATNPNIQIIINAERKGKAAMLNELVSGAKGDILVVTDANVMFTPSVIRKLAEGFADSRTGLCDATVHPFSADDTGITRQEIMYSRFETALKRAEGLLWGAMPGPYGGCYAVRRSLFPRLPENTLVDDLLVGLSVLKENYRAFNIPDAVVFEDTQPDMIEQYRRRTRIAAGSFQNLFRFGLCISERAGALFAFLSHKIMRWLTPLLLVLFFMTTVILSGSSYFYFCLTAFQLIFIILSVIDIMLDRRGKKLFIQRYVTQFLLMNAALATGFVKAVRGIESGIWEPTKRV
ncbi:MAG TPA: glycosyltransferase [Bacteroidales bacterium]|jgi:cellulose synthase/poly-beta-1,6-N-acetylglucosamine synthase-like glycosyltransferase|nr:glycosyltransferase [Bacteroidales bacterium]MDI9532812.1 glycosyltransferase [Bacteroidota bacterium]MBP7035617.1 glycosyltransferase [Bacteroidales bacterium]MZQ78860.1 glycosyltransferase [Bacteroidales bacterium]HNY56985.1 glycosyltransferase [Bacteroidales bacterium]